jgi:hypothetical protein
LFFVCLFVWQHWGLNSGPTHLLGRTSYHFSPWEEEVWSPMRLGTRPGLKQELISWGAKTKYPPECQTPCGQVIGAAGAQRRDRLLTGLPFNMREVLWFPISSLPKLHSALSLPVNLLQPRLSSPLLFPSQGPWPCVLRYIICSAPLHCGVASTIL